MRRLLRTTYYLLRTEPRGLTLIEVLIVLVIMSLLAVMLAGAYGNFRSVQNLQAGSAAAASLFSRARSEAVAGVDGMPHGVHVGTNTLTLFEGISYAAGSSSNEVVALVGNLAVSATSLAGGGSDVIFAQLTGETAEPGTITLQAGTDSSRHKIITVSAAGIVSVQ